MWPEFALRSSARRWLGTGGLAQTRRTQLLDVGPSDKNPTSLRRFVGSVEHVFDISIGKLVVVELDRVVASDSIAQMIPHKSPASTRDSSARRVNSTSDVRRDALDVNQ